MRPEWVLEPWSWEKTTGRLLGQRFCFQLFPGDQGANACDGFCSAPRKGWNLGTYDPVDTPTLVCSHTRLTRWRDTAPPLPPRRLTGA